MRDVETRLLAFLRQQPTAEVIDELSLPVTGDAPKHADFFLAERAVVVEVKALYEDPSHKVDSTVTPHRDRPEFPLFYGEADVAKVVAHLPDGDRIMNQMAERLTRSVENSFRSANKQIASTKAVFETAEAEGVLILVNEGVEILSPEMIAWRLAQMLGKCNSEGDTRYPHINMIWVLSEAHRLDHPHLSTVKLLPAMLIASDRCPPTERTTALVNALQPAWAAFNKVPFVDLGEAKPGQFTWRRVSEERKDESSPAPAHEWWRREYRKDAYLRSLSWQELLAHGANVVQELQSFFVLEPGAAAPARSVTKDSHQCNALTEQWTHFLEEMNYRAIDMRELARYQGRLP
jgi:hypothetical protein